MDRETTQRLLRDSIIFLCKTYLGADATAGFEIDSIICLSRRNGNVGDSGHTALDDQRPVVFKFHEFVTEEHLSAMDNGQFYQSSMGDGLWRARDLPHEYGIVPSSGTASKKRKAGEMVASDKFGDVAKKVSSAGNVGQTNINGSAQDLSNIKQGSVWSHDSDLCETINLRLTRSDSAPKLKTEIQNADKNISKRRDLSSVMSANSSLNNSSSLQANCSKNHQGVNSVAETSSVESRPLISNVRTLNSKSVTQEGKSVTEKSEDGPMNAKTRDALDQSGIDSSSSMEQSVPRSCDVCHQLFSDFPKFNVHCTSVHGRFACPFCELSFPHESARERHLFEHTGEPVDEDSVSDERASPVNAELSFGSANFEGHSTMSSSAIDLSSENEDELMGSNGAYFESHLLSRRGTISTHALRAIASLDPSRPFVCDVCRAQFEESSELCEHCALVHRRIPCPYCGRSFSQKASMERHQRQHTGERPYQCTMCHLSYTRKENLQTHYSRMHSMSAGAASNMQHPDFADIE